MTREYRFFGTPLRFSEEWQTCHGYVGPMDVYMRKEHTTPNWDVSVRVFNWHLAGAADQDPTVALKLAEDNAKRQILELLKPVVGELGELLRDPSAR